EVPDLDDVEDRDEEEDGVDVVLAAERLELVRHLPDLDHGVDEAERAEDERHDRVARLADRATTRRGDDGCAAAGHAVARCRCAVTLLGRAVAGLRCTGLRATRLRSAVTALRGRSKTTGARGWSAVATSWWLTVAARGGRLAVAATGRRETGLL